MNNINNPKMYNLAKFEGEVIFGEVYKASQYAPDYMFPAPNFLDKDGHVDWMVQEFDDNVSTKSMPQMVFHVIDVKDVDDRNFNTGNYSLSDKFINYHIKSPLIPYGYYVAFRLVENNKRSRKFILVNTQEMIQKCTLDNRGSYSLISLNDVKANCDYKLIQEETI